MNKDRTPFPSPLKRGRGEVMAFPGRLVFAPFVVVVGSRYFFPVPECLLSWLENCLPVVALAKAG